MSPASNSRFSGFFYDNNELCQENGTGLLLKYLYFQLFLDYLHTSILRTAGFTGI